MARTTKDLDNATSIYQRINKIREDKGVTLPVALEMGNVAKGAYADARHTYNTHHGIRMRASSKQPARKKPGRPQGISQLPKEKVRHKKLDLGPAPQETGKLVLIMGTPEQIREVLK